MADLTYFVALPFERDADGELAAMRRRYGSFGLPAHEAKQ
jgi:hypothetical protein